MRAAGSKVQVMWPVVRRYRDMPFSKDRETTAVPLERTTESLLFDMELTMGETPSIPSDTTVNHLDPDLIIAASEIEQCSRLETDFERRLMQAYIKVKGLCLRDGHLDYHLLSDRLQEWHFAVVLVGDEKEGRCTRVYPPKHPFLLCFESYASQLVDDPVILDPHFKSQFDIQNPTMAYSGVMETLPDAFIGHRERLELLVEILCREMRRSFQKMQRALPPWRGFQAMLSKWKSPSGEILKEIGNACVGSC